MKTISILIALIGMISLTVFLYNKLVELIDQRIEKFIADLSDCMNQYSQRSKLDQRPADEPDNPTKPTSHW